MTKFVVVYSDTLAMMGKSVKDALGRVREGWFIFEDGKPGYPYKSKEEAISQANALVSIRNCGNVRIIP